jgi:hypothetical protein
MSGCQKQGKSGILGGLEKSNRKAAFGPAQTAAQGPQPYARGICGGCRDVLQILPGRGSGEETGFTALDAGKVGKRLRFGGSSAVGAYHSKI